ncbi:hypothetical protein B0H17DRAFT_1208106 [Mycena rosella]|uniref:Uncharacterized protein n=1 Tax=Mycena rosella TaxID=1033263 RepID=A0AAD7D1F5_MYCRO|nr:hypothetical protein B0H17DRAFT_1208106 [Mycena rosella]
MAPAATFCNLPLSTSFDSELESSLLSLDWVLSSGVSASHSVACGLLSLSCSDGPLPLPPMDVDDSGPPFSCVCEDLSAPGCPSTSSAVHAHVHNTPTSSLNILRDIFTAHYGTHSQLLLPYILYTITI